MPIGGKVCKSCNFNAFTNQYESAPIRPVQQPVRQASVQQSAHQAPVQKPVAPPPAQQKPTVNPRPAQQSTPAQTPPQPALKAKKQKNNGFVRFISTVLSVVLAVTVGYIAKNGVYSLITQRSNAPATVSQPEKKESSADFTALLNEWGISYISRITEGNSECFAKAADEYTFEILEYGYIGDTVTEQYDTIYYDISKLDESQIQQLEEMLRTSAAESMPYCSAEYQRIGTQFFVVQLHIADMKSKDTLSAMAAAGAIGLTDGKVPDWISRKASRQGLLNNGYIQ